MDCGGIGKVVKNEICDDPDKELVDAQIIEVLQFGKYKACLYDARQG